MDAGLPTVEDLEKLPLRAVVAYAARTARRLSAALRGVVPDDAVENLFRLVDAVWSTDQIGRADLTSIAAAAQRMAEAYAAAPAGAKSLETFLIVFSLCHAAFAATSTIEAAVSPGHAPAQLKIAAKEAQRAVRLSRVLDHRPADAAAEAAREDYKVLLMTFGQCDEVRIGAPVHCFESAEDWAGPTE